MADTRRVVTSVNKEGKSVITLDGPSPANKNLRMVFESASVPVDLTDETDYAKKREEGFRWREDRQIWTPGLHVATGIIPPGTKNRIMHRTETCDVGVFLYGSAYIVLDSGEEALLKAGDTFVFKGTTHTFRNASETEPAKIFAASVGTKPLKINGEPFEEHFDTAIYTHGHN